MARARFAIINLFLGEPREQRPGGRRHEREQRLGKRAEAIADHGQQFALA
jgi:hypothetical protein